MSDFPESLQYLLAIAAAYALSIPLLIHLSARAVMKILITVTKKDRDYGN